MTGLAQLRRVRLSDPEAAPLLAGLREEYRQRYAGVDVMADADVAEFDAPDGAFVVLVLDGETVAGAGLRRLDARTAEVKRMWTAPLHRRQGRARQVLAALEDAARQLSYTRIRLETGPAQPEAVALYLSVGYQQIPVYGRHELAIAFERQLPAAVPSGSVRPWRRRHG